MDGFIEDMLKEDKGFGDITSEALIPKDQEIYAIIVSKDVGVAAGMDIVEEMFLEEGIKTVKLVEDGNLIEKGDILFKLKGNARKILLLERTALNITMRMSGVATATNDICRKVHDVNPNLRIAGTRKTSPGFSIFDKEAITIGGGDSHRYGLDDMVLIKDNHIAAVGSVEEALKRALDNVSFSKKIEIEVETIGDAINVAGLGADIIMLDNFYPDKAQECIEKLEELDLRDNVLIEISGGITSDNIMDYAKLNIDIISLGALTHSTRSLDYSLKVVKSLD
ncbi:carboxylating nicotinate-nucleotide diphosphorylase [Methanobrevibacter boviskoreani]|uniref:carboxylating nicotinate-nucleotide diphosphorylase n=1 Tax=Methanobrevibacter boviskoreani TaxID=1348249 RepID=UPI0023A838AB|nr:carboxylating nicotinate-nucleotide diphosphorylase [Methanobrevibacter boviskoreani]MCI6774613.1 carboxylating nicotinate-nucleotide diphosphorylase [Methanobrevibacter boviskoreani]MDY5614129.1 carboxylating nicotinate-nucleotide diphosphorylase [Methanobrevibacter boviskoreani]